MTSINIPNSVTNIGYNAFNGCTSLSSITIPNSVTEFGDSAFNGCTGLTSINIPNSVTKIGQNAFNGCTGLTSITIPNSVNFIKQNPFVACKNLASIIVESGNTLYDSRNNCNAIITTNSNRLISGCQNTTIPDGVKEIGVYAFSGCKNLTSIEIPVSVTSFGDNAFYDCTGLTSISYTGTIEQYNAISKGTNWNAKVPATVVHCTDGDAPI